MPMPPGPEDDGNTEQEVDPDPTQNPDPLARLLAGPWSTIYSNHTYFAAGQPPHPGKTLGIFRFDEMKLVKGTLLPNVLGKASQIHFEGFYSVIREAATGLVRGSIQIMLPNVPAPPPANEPPRLLAVLDYVLRDRDEMDWVLVGSADPERVVVAGGKMFRINTQLGQSASKRPKGRGSKPIP